MRKLGIISNDDDANCAAAAEFDKFLNTTVQPRHFAALRDIFPAANALSDADLMQIASQAGTVSANA